MELAVGPILDLLLSSSPGVVVCIRTGIRTACLIAVSVLLATSCGTAAKDTGAPPDLGDKIGMAFAYPFDREPASFLYLNGTSYRYEQFGSDTMRDAVVRDEGGNANRVADLLAQHGSELGNGPLPAEAATRVPVLAYGSNASPAQLKRKFSAPRFPRGWAAIPTLKGKLQDFEVVYAAHFAPYGSIPATIQYAPGAEQEVFVSLLDPAELEQMHSTEGIDPKATRSTYSYGKLSNIRLELENGAKLAEAYTYVDNYGAAQFDGATYSLAAVPGNSASPKKTQREMQDLARQRVPAGGGSATCAGQDDTVRRIVCETVVDPCTKTGREIQIQDHGYFRRFAVPGERPVTYTVVAGSDTAGAPGSGTQC